MSSFVGKHADFIGFTTSLICAIHCLFLPILLSLAPVLGGTFLSNPLTEITLIILSLIIATLSISSVFFKYHKSPVPFTIVIIGFVLIFIGRFFGTEESEVWFTSSGSISIALGHIINWRMLNTRTHKID